MNKIVLMAVVCGLLFACQQPTNKKVTEKVVVKEENKKDNVKEVKLTKETKVTKKTSKTTKQSVQKQAMMEQQPSMHVKHMVLKG